MSGPVWHREGKGHPLLGLTSTVCRIAVAEALNVVMGLTELGAWFQVAMPACGVTVCRVFMNPAAFASSGYPEQSRRSLREHGVKARVWSMVA